MKTIYDYPNCPVCGSSLKGHVNYEPCNPQPKLDWKSDLLNKLEEPESNFSDKNRWIVDWVEGLLSLQKEHDARVAEKIRETGVIRNNHCEQCRALVSGFEVACDSIAKSIREQE